MGFLEFLAAGAAPEVAADDDLPDGAQRWSAASTWNGTLPGPHQAVTVAAGRTPEMAGVVMWIVERYGCEAPRRDAALRRMRP